MNPCLSLNIDERTTSILLARLMSTLDQYQELILSCIHRRGYYLKFPSDIPLARSFGSAAHKSFLFDILVRQGRKH